MNNPHAIPASTETVQDMPKLHPPFKRASVQVGGRQRFVVTPEVDPEYAWVFTEPEVQAVEKLDGTNVSVVVKDGKVRRIFNRTTELDFFGGHPAITALIHSAERGYLPKEDGQFFGEALGGKIQSNPLGLKTPLWLPFHRLYHKYAYKSFHKYPKTFEGWSNWFKEDLFSLVGKDYGHEKVFAEGVVFTHPDGRMSKLRRDMFDWYEGNQHKE